MDRDYFGAYKNINSFTHRMNKIISGGKTNAQEIARYAYGNDDNTSVQKVKRHINWLCEKITHNSGNVRDRMKNAGIDLKDINERLEKVKRQFS